MKITSGHAPRGPTEVMVDADTADKHDLKLGDELARPSPSPATSRAKISGIATFTGHQPRRGVVYFDTATAQRKLLGETGVFTNVNVTAAAGVSDDAAEEERRRGARRRHVQGADRQGGRRRQTARTSAPSWTS